MSAAIVPGRGTRQPSSSLGRILRSTATETPSPISRRPYNALLRRASKIVCGLEAGLSEAERYTVADHVVAQLKERSDPWHLNEEAPSGADRRLDHLQENFLMGEAKTKRRLALGRPDALRATLVGGIINCSGLDVLALIGPSPPVRITERSTGARRFGHNPRPADGTLSPKDSRGPIAFLIAMIGVASCILGGLYRLFGDDHPSDEVKKRRKPSWCQLEVASVRHQNPALAGLRVHQSHVASCCNLSHTHNVGTRPVLSRTFRQAGDDCERPQVQGWPVRGLSRS